MSETAEMIERQGEDLDIIGDDISRTHKNVEMAGRQVVEASDYQKRTKRKYIVFAFLVIMLCLLVMVPVLILT